MIHQSEHSLSGEGFRGGSLIWQPGPRNNLDTVYVRNAGIAPFTIASLYENLSLYLIFRFPVLVDKFQSNQVFLLPPVGSQSAPDLSVRELYLQ